MIELNTMNIDDVNRAISGLERMKQPYIEIQLIVTPKGQHASHAAITINDSIRVLVVFFARITPSVKMYEKKQIVYSNDYVIMNGNDYIVIECNSFTTDKNIIFMSKENIESTIKYLKQLRFEMQLKQHERGKNERL